MSETDIAAKEAIPPKRRPFRRFYALFGPSRKDVRRGGENIHTDVKTKAYSPAQVTMKDKERFIPVSRRALINRLFREEMWHEGELQDGKRFIRCLSAWRHQTYRSRLSTLKESYLPFSPDRDTIRAASYNPTQRRELRIKFMEKMGDLLERANYEKVTAQDLDLLLTSDSPYGLKLKVDLDEFDDVLIYFRGAKTKMEEYRDWKWAYLKKFQVETPIFQRLFVALKLKSETERIQELMLEHDASRDEAIKLLKKRRAMLPEEVTDEFIYLKMFKEIPQDDLEMMFPNTVVAFKFLDKIKLGLTAGGGTVAGLAGIVPKLFTATALLNPVVLVTTLAGFIGLMVRQGMKFFNQRNQYMMVLAQNLYFHNLANNRGVLTLIVDRAEEEDIKEEILLYNFLVRHQGTGLNKTQKEIEKFLSSEFGVDIRFDLEDAFSRLLQDGLVYKTESGHYEVKTPEQGIAHLEHLWREAFLDEKSGETGLKETEQEELSFIDQSAQMQDETIDERDSELDKLLAS